MATTHNVQCSPTLWYNLQRRVLRGPIRVDGMERSSNWLIDIPREDCIDRLLT